MTPLPQKSANTLRILHTADWHIGKQLNGENRYNEFGEFLAWLIKTIKQHEVDLLIVAGDIFDTMTPSHTAQELYFQFLGELKNTSCHNVVIIAGNHDSPSLLNAPKTLFRHFNIYVIATKTDNIFDEIITLTNKNGQNIAKICAIPYLRERDVRTEHFGELDKRNQSMLDGIAQHYQALATACQDDSLPIIATGHLFTQGAMPSADDDGMRKLYAGESKVGTLGLVSPSIFKGFDYVALGHIHREQMVGNQNHIRYSGSPMAFCFDEVNQEKKVLLIDFNDKIPTVTPIIVPVFRKLVSLKGDWQTLKNDLKTLAKTHQTHTGNAIWLAVECTENTPSDLKASVLAMIQDCPIQLIICQKPKLQDTHNPTFNAQSLNELTPNDVFDTLLSNQQTSNKKTPVLDNDEKEYLTRLYQEIVFEVENDDIMAV